MVIKPLTPLLPALAVSKTILPLLAVTLYPVVIVTVPPVVPVPVVDPAERKKIPPVPLLPLPTVT